MACYTNIKVKNPDVEVEDVLDFFDEIAFLVKKGALNKEMVWHEFYHWIRLYMQSSEKYITERRLKESSVWEDIVNLYPKLKKLEKKRYPETYKEKLDDETLKKYLSEGV